MTAAAVLVLRKRRPDWRAVSDLGISLGPPGICGSYFVAAVSNADLRAPRLRDRFGRYCLGAHSIFTGKDAGATFSATETR
jgi:hypothetical protein